MESQNALGCERNIQSEKKWLNNLLDEFRINLILNTNAIKICAVKLIKKKVKTQHRL